MSEWNNIGQVEQDKEKEIKINEVISFFMGYKRRLIKVAILSALMGVLVAIFSQDEFTATTSFIPQLGDGERLSNGFSGLASITGFNLSGANSDNIILPAVYPKIVSSIRFRLDLSRSKIVLNPGDTDSISYSDYYESHYRPSVLSKIKKYTLGLPFVIIGAIKGTSKESEFRSSDYNFLKLTNSEKEDVERILTQLIVQHNERNGYVSIFYNMDNPFLAAQMVEHTKSLLQNQLISVKIKNAQLQLDFIEERHAEKQVEFLETETKLAQFLDANQNLTSQLARNRQKQLEAEYSLILGVYTELAKQLEQSKIQVAKDTPVFSVIDPVSVPSEKSAPKRSLMVVLFTVVGIFIMMVYILIKFVQKQNIYNFS